MTTTNKTAMADLSEIRRALSLIVAPGDWTELRIPKTGPTKTVSGYFNSETLDKMAQAAATWNGKAGGIYLTLNPVNPALSARAENYAKPYAEYATADADIIRRLWLLGDFDAVRPAGISSTDAEHEAAIERAKQALDYLLSIGFNRNSLVLADSGNGAHLLLRIDLPNDADSTSLCQRFLQALDLKFTDGKVAADLTTYNAARISKIYGTYACKGDNTTERPHRLARILDLPETNEPATRELLEQLAATIPTRPTIAPTNGQRIDLPVWLAKYNIKIHHTKAWNGGNLFVLSECVWNPEHNHGEAWAYQFPDGTLAAGCHHSSCSQYHWADLREKYEPKTTLAGKTAHASFRLTKLSDLLKEPAEDIAYLWENTLIKSGLSLIVAKPKVGKSTLARNLALAIAKGESLFLGRNIIGSGPVVYLALEEKRSEVKKHFERMGATENLPIFIHTGSAPEQAIAGLRKAIIESKAIFAIVDPLQRLVRIPDLNDYASVSLALEPLMQIARDTGCHILLIHHANKGIAREGGDSILGSTAIFGSVDCALIMKRNESYRTIESIQRYGEDLPRTVLTFDVVTGLTSSGGTLEDAEVAECGKAILELLADHEMPEKEIKDGITDHKGGTVSKSLRVLCQEGKIQRQGLGKKGDPYQYATVTKNTGDSRDSYIEIPTIPTIDSSFNSDPLPKTDDTLNTLEAILGMPPSEVLKIWSAEGKPVIHLGPGENCEDLEKMLARPDVSERHLKAIRAWLDKVLKLKSES